MPRRQRPGEWVFIYAEVPPDLKARLEYAAKQDGRSLTAYLIRWLQTLPPAPPEMVEEARPKKKKGGKG